MIKKAQERTGLELLSRSRRRSRRGGGGFGPFGRIQSDPLSLAFFSLAALGIIRLKRSPKTDVLMCANS